MKTVMSVTQYVKLVIPAVIVLLILIAMSMHLDQFALLMDHVKFVMTTMTALEFRDVMLHFNALNVIKEHHARIQIISVLITTALNVKIMMTVTTLLSHTADSVSNVSNVNLTGTVLKTMLQIVTKRMKFVKDALMTLNVITSLERIDATMETTLAMNVSLILIANNSTTSIMTVMLMEFASMNVLIITVVVIQKNQFVLRTQ